MAETEDSARGSKRIWARTRFDLEGYGGAAAALLVGILLGWLWSPLFWLGFIIAVFILMATRSQKRVPPELANLVLAPCDGIVHSVAIALPPTELRLEGGEWLRLRVASAPYATNPVYASLTGEISSVIMEEPDSSVLTAGHPDLPGLAVAHITLASLDKTIGYTVATGGLGPRLEMISEAGDPVRAGRVIGKRRLGGWCDIYLAADAKLLVSVGQTLIGAETVLCRLLRTAEEDLQASKTVSVNETEDETLEDVGSARDETPSDLETLVDEETLEDTPAQVPEVDIDEVQNDVVEQTIKEPADDDPEDAVAELFKKLTDNEASKS